MEQDMKQILKDIPTLEDDQLETIDGVFSEMYKQYMQEFGKADKKTQDASIICGALNDEKIKREARKTYKKLPDTYNELMTMILMGEVNIHGLSKEDFK